MPLIDCPTITAPPRDRLDPNMLQANIEIKLNDAGDQWYVAACSANIDNKDFYPMPLGERFATKDEAITEMKRRMIEWFTKNGRMKTEEKIEWRVP